MDARQEARDRFDRVMVWPDKIVMAACLFGLGMPATFMLGQFLDGTKLTYPDLMFYLSVKFAVLAVYGFYFATRFVAALVIAATAVRRRYHANARGASDLPADSPVARQTAHALVAGK